VELSKELATTCVLVKHAADPQEVREQFEALAREEEGLREHAKRWENIASRRAAREEGGLGGYASTAIGRTLGLPRGLGELALRGAATGAGVYGGGVLGRELGERFARLRPEDVAALFTPPTGDKGKIPAVQQRLEPISRRHLAPQLAARRALLFEQAYPGIPPETVEAWAKAEYGGPEKGPGKPKGNLPVHSAIQPGTYKGEAVGYPKQRPSLSLRELEPFFEMDPAKAEAARAASEAGAEPKRLVREVTKELGGMTGERDLRFKRLFRDLAEMDPEVVSKALASDPLADVPRAGEARAAIGKHLGESVAKHVPGMEGGDVHALRQRLVAEFGEENIPAVRRLIRQTLAESDLPTGVARWGRAGKVLGGGAGLLLSALPFTAYALWAKHKGGERAMRAKSEARRLLEQATHKGQQREELLEALEAASEK